MLARVAPILLAAACAAPERDEEAERAAFALVTSPPAAWAAAARPVLALGGHRAVPALLQALQSHPHAPGAQPAIAALGTLGDPGSLPHLCGWLDGRDENLAAEAALALGRIGSTAAEGPLREAMADRQRPVYARTAAAAALVDRGDRGAAVAFLCDVLLAGTDRGRARGEAAGLPVDRARWAVERNLAIAALCRAAPEAGFDLDADASWPRLAAGVEGVRRRFGLPR